jgi:poly(A) polymerase
MLKRIRELLSRKGRKNAEASPPAPVTPPLIHHGPRVVHRPIAHADLDPDAVKIIQRLTRFDHTAYLVGGCVRDLLLDRKPKDFDVGTSATPRQIKRLFRNCRIIGRRFRLAHIYFQDGKIIEVATFRACDVQDGAPAEPHDDLLIRDDNVFGTAEEDALRRDFTINALFYDVNAESVLDHAAGLDDLRRHLVRTIGDPAIRFREDPVRGLRAVKFAARLGFELEPRTAEALRRTRGELKKAAAPRILEELNRFGREGAARRSFEMLRETGLLEEILPEIAASAASDRAWELLLELLGHLDVTRSKDGREVRTGEILALLLLPGLASPLGLNGHDGAHPAPRGDLQAAIDAPLRSIGERLRVPRREIEHCRVVLAALGRLIHGGRAPSGRGPRQAASRREGVPDAQWMLGVIARIGGPAASQAQTALSRPADAAGEAADAASPGRRRRRSRRGGRGRRAAGAGGEGAARRPAPPATRPAEAPRAETPRAEAPRAEASRRDLPPVWDDNYFFAALPSAPDPDEEAPAAAPSAVASTVEAGTAEGTDAATPARRRRRGRRRGRRGGRGGQRAAGAEVAAAAAVLDAEPEGLEPENEDEDEP